MSTIGQLLIVLKADPTGLREGLERGKQLIQQFARNPRLVQIPEGATVSAGEEAAANLIAGLKNRLAAEETILARDFVDKVIDEKRWRAEGIAARQEFNKGLVSGAERLEARGLLSENTRAVIFREIDTAAEVAARRAQAAAKVASDKQRLANVFDPRLGLATTAAARETDKLLKSASKSYNDTLSGLKVKLAAGSLDKRSYQVAAAQASAAFNGTLVQGLSRVEGLKGFTDNVRDVIVSNFKLTGRTAANALGQSVGSQGAAAGNIFAQQFISKATQANRLAGVARTMSIAITAPIVAAGVAAVRSAKGLDDAMLSIQARAGATNAQLDALANQAREIARTSQFTVTQVAQAQAGLATSGGLTPMDVLKATQPVISLATAQQLDLGRATEITTGAMREFNLTSADTPKIVDQLVRAAQLGHTTVDSLAESLNLVGPAAHESGVSLRDTLSVLGALASAHITGSRAGQNFVGMLKNLQNPTRQQAAELKRLGVDVLDASGNIRPLAVIVGELESKLKNAGQNFALFGQRAGVGAGALLAIGGVKRQEFNNALDQSSGSAARAAAIMQSGFTGALQRLIAALTALGAAIAQSGLLDVLTRVIGVITTMVQGFAGAPAPVLALVTAVFAFVAAAGPLLYTIAKISAGLNVLRAAAILSAGAEGVGALVGGIVSLSALLTGGVIVAGLAALAGMLYLSGKAARDASADLLVYQKHLADVTTQGKAAAAAEVDTLLAQSAKAFEELDRARQAFAKKFPRGANPALEALGEVPEFDAITKAREHLEQLGARLGAARDVLDQFTASENATSKASEEMKRQLADILKANDKFPVMDFGGPKGPSALDLLIDRAKQAVDQFELLREVQEAATKRSEAVGRFPVTIPAKELLRTIVDLRAESVRLQAALTQIPDPLGKGAEDAARMLREVLSVNKALDEAQNQLKFTRTTDVNKANPQVNTGASSGIRKLFGDLEAPVLRVSEGLDLMAQTVSSTIPAVATFITGLGKLTTGVEAVASFIANPRTLVAKTAAGATDAFGTAANVLGIVGTVGGAISTLVGVFGALTSEQHAARELQKQNLDELRKLRATTELQGRGASALLASRTVVATALATTRVGANTGQGAQTVAFFDALRKSGLSFDAITQIAEQFGITLRDKDGLIAASLDTFNQALILATQNVGHFDNTLADQQKKQALVQNVNDVNQTPQQIIKNAIDIFTQFDKNLAPIFAGLNADTAEGRAQIKAVLKNLVNIIATTGLTAEQLGNFQSLDDLISVIDTMEGAFDDLANAANQVTDALSNIPQGFRIALATFEATTPVAPRQSPLLPQPAQPPASPFPTTGGIPQSAIVAQDNSVTFTGPISIVPGEGETTEEAIKKFIRNAKSQARGAGRLPSEWPSLVGN
jgi:TP901 family phage tail tape measure protein